jgi:hypothetical protein
MITVIAVATGLERMQLIPFTTTTIIGRNIQSIRFCERD